MKKPELRRGYEKGSPLSLCYDNCNNLVLSQVSIMVELVG